MLEAIVNRFDRVSRYFAIAGGWILLALSFYIGIDVVGRKLFNFSLQGSDELGGYVLAIICAWGFSYALTMKAHIRLTALLAKFPERLQAIANIAAYAMLVLLSFLLMWRGTAMFLETIEIKAVAPTPLETPLWIPHGLWTVGLVWFFLHVLVYFMLSLTLGTQRRFRELNEIFGVEK